MAFVDEVLAEFKGELTIDQIYQMTYKELGYLREHRREMMKANPGMAEEASLRALLGK